MLDFGLSTESRPTGRAKFSYVYDFRQNCISFEYSKYIRCEQMIRGEDGSPSAAFPVFSLESLDRIKSITPEVVAPLRDQVIAKLESTVALNRGFFDLEAISDYTRTAEDIRTWAAEPAEAVLQRIKETVQSQATMCTPESEEEVMDFLIKKNIPVGRGYQPVSRKRPRRQK
ncbi:hypothetical protein Y032_0061g3292 [Ancylostoma ceylanicum]|uniref:Uncharacterized protein n=1 Tax=Ancylostoma ceylanicum TaxID=53326 RepID=A0A016U2Y9_9BILA|nr:hypothetical protein Y032_0061g3292 [Ancylostoma ceylanicum]